MCFGRASRLVKSGFYLLVIGAGFEPASEVTTHRPRFTSPILPIWGDACKRLPIPPPYRLHPVETGCPNRPTEIFLCKELLF